MHGSKTLHHLQRRRSLKELSTWANLVGYKVIREGTGIEFGEVGGD